MNITMDYNLLKNIYKEIGVDKFFEIFNKTYSDFDLYSMSQDWINNKEYILKFKGGNGDIVINWI